MLRLRPYKKTDAKTIEKWIKDESVFRLWGGERFGNFPIDAEIINEKYYSDNGDCIEDDNFFPMTAFDENGIVGHFIMRYTGGDNIILRFGWVIIDSSRRGGGLGKEMLKLGLRYAFDIYGARKVTIGVYENNTPAYKCYCSVGFRQISEQSASGLNSDNSDQRVIELEMTEEEYRQ